MAKLKQFEEDKTWKCYVADSLQMLPQRKWFKKTFSERYLPPVPEDNRTGDDVASEVIRKLGLNLE